MTEQLCEALVRVLVHSLWQGLLIAGIVAAILRCLPARRAETRYAISLAGLFLIVGCGMVTWSVLTLDPPDRIPQQSVADSSPTTVPTSTRDPALAERITPAAPNPDASTMNQPVGVTTLGMNLRRWMPWIAAAWLIGVCVMLARTASAIVQVRRWQTFTGPMTSGDSLNQLLAVKDDLCARLGLQRRVSLIACTLAEVPSVVGTWWPCILIPPAMLTGIPLDQWRIIIAHELAHIRRYDVFVNIIQMLIESLLFFNPAVWWLSRQIRVEREACCDAIAARVCGQPIGVARTLVEFAASLQGDARWPAPQGLVAFADHTDEGELTDRVRRLVQPDTAASPRVSWLGLSVVVMSLIVMAGAMQWGTHVAVKTAVQLISPQERVKKLEQLQADVTGLQLPPETSTDPAGSAITPAAPAQPQLIPVTFVVRTESGTPVPKGLQLDVVVRRGNSSGIERVNGPQTEVPEFRETVKYSPCQLRVGIQWEGYAPTVSPVVNVVAGSKSATVELLLRKGRVAKVQIVDARQQPIPRAEIKLRIPLALESTSWAWRESEYQGDDAGWVTFDNIGDATYELHVKAAGFQRQLSKLTFQDPAAPVISLVPAVPAPMHVQDAATGHPVPHARFVLAHIQRNNAGNQLGDPRTSTDKWNLYGETDGKGDATLDELQDGASYTFGVLAEGYSMAVAADVYSGRKLSTIKLLPPIKLAGRIEGDLSKLQQSNGSNGGKPLLSFNNAFFPRHFDYGTVPVSPDGAFEIPNRAANEHMQLHLPDRVVEYVLTESLTDVVLKINEPAAAAKIPTRPVIIQLSGTSLGAPARGTLYVWWAHPQQLSRNTSNKTLPLRGDQIELEVPVGAILSFRAENLVGYRIPERNEFEITPGTTPQTIKVPATPAGGISGTIVRADGTLATSAHVTVLASSLPPGITEYSQLNPNGSSASATFLRSLPLGGSYVILAREVTDSHSVWTASEVIRLDESHPIEELRLQLPRGRTIPIKVVDPDGRPIPNQTVVIHPSVSYPKSHSYGFQITRTTNSLGVATFEEISVDTAISPLALDLTVEVVNPKFIGWNKPINLRLPIEIRLRAGITAAGLVIDSASGKPVANTPIWLSPADYRTATYSGLPRTTTDAEGRFQFEGLEPIEYMGYVEGAAPQGTLFKKLPGGGTRIETPASVEPLRLNGRAAGPTRWEVSVYPK